MSQLSFEFNNRASSPVEVEPAPSSVPNPDKKNRRRTYRPDFKRFGWLTFLLGREAREDAAALYRWCRTMEAEAGTLAKIENLKGLILDAYAGRNTIDPVFQSFQRAVERCQIPAAYPLAFLDGFEKDIAGGNFETLEDVLAYAYHVSGTVSLMMAHVMKLSHPGALKNACDMALAAQLTIIARNVREDFERGRVYLPLAWLREEGVAPEDLFIPKSRPAVWRVVVRLLEAADRLYASGDIGLRFLSFRPALAVAAVRRVHAETGRRLLTVGPTALDCPVVASPVRERLVAVRGAWPVLRQLPSRIKSPWKPAPINLLWKIPAASK